VTRTPIIDRAVAIGGGTGLPLVLRCLRGLAKDTAAVVSVADNGGSSGRLREELGMLPPGDLRKCLVALADPKSFLASLFEYRFPAGEGLEGHTLGNLIIAALVDLEGDFAQAVADAGRLIGAGGRVLPSTMEDVTLYACDKDGHMIAGQFDIATGPEQPRSVYLEPPSPPVFDQTDEALRTADLIVIGPGSLYTSILPNLLVAGVPEAIRAARATRVYVMNLTSQPGETHGYTAAEHVDALERHREGLIDVIVMNDVDAYTDEQRDLLAERGLTIVADDGTLASGDIPLVTAPLASRADPAQHDCGALCDLLAGLVSGEAREAATGKAPGEAIV